MPPGRSEGMQRLRAVVEVKRAVDEAGEIMKRLGAGFILPWVWVATWACAPSGQPEPQALSIAAKAAVRQAYTEAVAWAPEPELRYVQGVGVGSTGRVLPGSGRWVVVYGSDELAEQLVVTVTPTTLERVTRPPQSPPGYATGAAELDGDWVDSPAVLMAVSEDGGVALLASPDASISMLLVPTSPPRWIVRVASGGATREWQVSARTGLVLQ